MNGKDKSWSRRIIYFFMRREDLSLPRISAGNFESIGRTERPECGLEFGVRFSGNRDWIKARC